MLHVDKAPDLAYSDQIAAQVAEPFVYDALAALTDLHAQTHDGITMHACHVLDRADGIALCEHCDRHVFLSGWEGYLPYVFLFDLMFNEKDNLVQNILLNKMKMGRPSLQNSQKKDRITGVRLCSDERALLEKAAVKSGLKLSKWMREILLEIAAVQTRG